MRPTLILLLFLCCLGISGCDGYKRSLEGRWINKETYVNKGIISSDSTDLVVRTLTLDGNGKGELKIAVNGRTGTHHTGKWTISNDVFVLDYDQGKSVYYRIIRVASERIVLRTEEGAERIFDRLQ